MRDPVDGVVFRDRLLVALDRAYRVRLTAIIADPGFGKSTLLETWASHSNVAWLTLTEAHRQLGVLARHLTDQVRLRVPDLPRDLRIAVRAEQGPEAAADEAGRASAYASLVAGALAARLHRPLVLILDDLHELGDSGPSLQLVEGLVRQAPERLHVVVASRRVVPFAIERLRSRGHVFELGAIDLGFSLDETVQLVWSVLGERDPATAQALWEAVGGWPAGLRLAIESLRLKPRSERAGEIRRVNTPEGPLFPYLMEEVLAKETPEIRELVIAVADLPGFNAGLCEALGIERPGDLIPLIARRRLYVEPTNQGTDLLVLSPLLRELLVPGISPAERRIRTQQASAWYRDNGFVREALACLVQVGDLESAAALLLEAGDALISVGASPLVVSVCRRLGPEQRTPQLDRVEGEAHQVLGDWDAALECFSRADPAGMSAPSVAWRVGLIHYMRGQPMAALEAFERTAGTDEKDPDVALVLAWSAAALWLLGRLVESRHRAARAMSAALTSGDHRALAAAHTVAAMVAASDGDRRGNEHHYLRALDHAEEAGDVLQIIRIRVNRGSRHLEEGSYRESIAELDEALRLADLTGFATLGGMATLNRGQAYLGLGRIDEAIADLDRSRRTFESVGSGFLALSLTHLGTFYRIRGDLAVARVHLTEALALARQTGDAQALVPAGAELARVIVSDDPDQAEQLIDEVLGYEPGLNRVSALLAGGWVASIRGDAGRGTKMATEAAELARVRRDYSGLAEALELVARCSDSDDERLQALSEARDLFRRLDNAIGIARTERDLALIEGGSSVVSRLKVAQRRLADLGARLEARETQALIDRVESQERPEVAVLTMGGFRVEQRGTPVSHTAWQSRKARDLLKLLVARRGRPTHREVLIEHLWPDEPEHKTANRLSVALSTVRAVLDPGRSCGQDHYVIADRSSVALDLSHMFVDVERFLAESEAALKDLKAGEAAAVSRLQSAEALYLGDFLEEDPYADWAVSLREQARARYIEVAETLARTAFDSGDYDAAVRYYLRLLERDPYSESASLHAVRALLAVGRHGEARRLYSTYSERMAELGMEAAPLPA